MKSRYRVLSVSSSLAFSAGVLGALICFPACSGSDATPSGNAGAGAGGAASTDSCAVDDDCTLGEIEIEITKPSDCMCLYGCVYLPQTKMTAARRASQHQKLCKSDVDGQGQPCGIDDCIVPGTALCMNGKCQVAPSDPER